jgi:serine protease Do
LTLSNLVITNAHVLGLQATEAAADDDPPALVVQIRIAENAWEIRKASLLAVDTLHDLALLRMEGKSAPALQMGDSASVREGNSIAFTGFPLGGALGFSPVTHRGIVSSITAAALPAPSAQQLSGTAVRGLRVGSFDVFQIDGTAYPGNSGGPMFDPQTGEVLGILNMVFVKGTRESALTHPSGISYAIPARYIQQLVKANASKTP